MANLMWSEVENNIVLGEIAEHYAKIEFMSYGFEVYDTLADDRGVDFIARKNGVFYEVQVKSVRNNNYAFISKSKMKVLSEKRLVCFMNFENLKNPQVYVIPSTEWYSKNPALTEKTYDNLKSKPEWGINFSKKNECLFEKYFAEKVLSNL